MHATISLDRRHVSWFDLVLDELIQMQTNKQDKEGTSLAWNADLLRQHVQSTSLGLELAQLVPVGAAKLLPALGSPSTDDFELVLNQYLRGLVDGVLGVVDDGSKLIHQVTTSHVEWYRKPLEWLHHGTVTREATKARIGTRITHLKRDAGLSKSGDEHVARRDLRDRRSYTCNGCDTDKRSCDENCNGSCDHCSGGCNEFFCSWTRPDNCGCDSSCYGSCDSCYSGCDEVDYSCDYDCECQAGYVGSGTNCAPCS